MKYLGEENFIKDLIVNTSEGGGQAKVIVTLSLNIYMFMQKT